MSWGSPDMPDDPEVTSATSLSRVEINSLTGSIVEPGDTMASQEPTPDTLHGILCFNCGLRSGRLHRYYRGRIITLCRQCADKPEEELPLPAILKDNHAA